MGTLKTIAETEESTVVAAYEPVRDRSEAYQSEAALEREFLRLLEGQGYERVKIHHEEELVRNLRTQLEALNGYRFGEADWARFFKEVIARENDGVLGKTRRLQHENLFAFRLHDGTIRNFMLLDKRHIHNNRLQVLNQYEVSREEGARHDNRYDVTVLVNGLPLVHVELKRRGVSIREAFNQIKRYQRDSFFAGAGLFEYVQVFVISNGTQTKYYSNTTREGHLKEQGKRGNKAGNSFEFTSYWADAKNRPIQDLVDFTKTFFARHTLLSLLTRYCVMTVKDELLVMRPYQIAATERILQKIATSTTYKQTGTPEAGGYIWHTTGSGKTLTSFKTALLACQREDIDKVLFVVDRKDLDHQTQKEYDRYQKGAANANTSTKKLEERLSSADKKILITTIQKLSIFIKRNRAHEVYRKHVVIIFDECHRSQFGEMHTAITKAFRHYHLFGFTGTPIFAVNSGAGKDPHLKTTEQAFGRQLHSYTIVNAIGDGNVLPFRIDYLKTIEQREGVEDKQVEAIDTKRALESGRRVSEVVRYILEHFDQKTKRGSCYIHDNGRRVSGFNSLFAVSSIPMAMKYYDEFKRQMQGTRKLRIATIFSYSPNEEDPGDLSCADEDFETEHLDEPSREFLERAIGDYNQLFKTSYDTSAEGFEGYYKNVSQRMQDRELDLLIVVNMFLTGFDAKTLNTLWVDKNLKMHGLIQAYSRTNRILNSVKTFGNIVCFRSLERETDEAIALFGDSEAKGMVLLKGYKDYLNGYDENGRHVPGYKELVARLLEEFPLGSVITGNEHKKDFVRLFGAILRLLNILSSFDSFAGDPTLSERELQDYKSWYLNIHEEMKREAPDREGINDDVEFEIELIKQVDVNIDYILMLVEKYHAGNCEDKEILVSIDKAVNSSPELRSKRELISDFIKTVNPASNVEEDWRAFVLGQKEAELSELIAAENLKEAETRALIENSFRDGELTTHGTDIDALMPAISRFGNKGETRAKKKASVMDKLRAFFEKFFGVIDAEPAGDALDFDAPDLEIPAEVVPEEETASAEILDFPRGESERKTYLNAAEDRATYTAEPSANPEPNPTSQTQGGNMAATKTEGGFRPMLISIRSDYTWQIFDTFEKKFEYRTLWPKNYTGGRIFIYESGTRGLRKVIGFFEGGVPIPETNEYGDYLAIPIKRPRKFKKPMTLEEFGKTFGVPTKTAPQAWQYVDISAAACEKYALPAKK